LTGLLAVMEGEVLSGEQGLPRALRETSHRLRVARGEYGGCR